MNIPLPENTNHSIYVAKRLSCGCVMQYSLHCDGDNDADWMMHGAEKLAFMFKDRIAKHNCSLVSDDNPNGIRR